MKLEEKNTTEITFHNEPKLSEHEVDNKFNERRLNLIPHVKNFISNHERFQNKKVSVSFAHEGVSSLVCIIETPDEKMVLKIPLSLSYSSGEGQFLKVWEKAGVKVPHVIEEGVISEHVYTLMEYIDAPILAEKYSWQEQIEKKIYLEMGSTLSLMHSPKTEGYGRVVNGKAEFNTFREWLESADMQKRFKYCKENMLLSDEHGSLDIALEILTEHINKTKSSYCHDDFGTGNIFATEPITVFDPNSRFNNGYIDLGRSIFSIIFNKGRNEAIEQIIKGYFGDDAYDIGVLHASIMLASYMKFTYAHQTNKIKKIQNIQEYLTKNKHLLER